VSQQSLMTHSTHNRSFRRRLFPSLLARNTHTSVFMTGHNRSIQ